MFRQLRLIPKIVSSISNFWVVALNKFGLLPAGHVTLKFRNGLKFLARANNSDVNDIALIALESDYLNNILHDLSQNASILDLGAHVGSFSLYCGQLRSDLHIFSVEPAPDSFKLLEQNIELNNRQDMILPINVAASNFDGESMFLVEGNSDSWKLAESQSGNHVPVKVRTLQSIVKENSIRNLQLIKIDIEGAEFQVVPASVDLLKTTKWIILEFHPQNGESLAETKKYFTKYLDAAGHQIVWTNEYTLITKSNA